MVKSFTDFLLNKYPVEVRKGKINEEGAYATVKKSKRLLLYRPPEDVLVVKANENVLCVKMGYADRTNVTISHLAGEWKRYLRHQAEFQQPLWSVISRSFKYHIRHKKLLAVLVVGLLLQTILEISVPFSLRTVTDQIESNDLSGLSRISLGLSCAIALSALGGWIYFLTAAELTARCIEALQNEMHDHMMTFHESILTGYPKEQLAAYFSTDLLAFEVAVNRCFDALKSSVNVAFFMGFIFSVDWRIAPFVILIQLAILNIPQELRTRAERASPVRLRKGREAFSAAMETLAGQKVVRDFALFDIRSKFFRERSHSYKTICVELFFNSRFYTEACFILNVSCNIAFLLFGAYMVLHGWLKFSSLVALYSAVGKVGSSVGNTLQVVPDFIKGLGGIHDIDKLLETRGPTVLAAEGQGRLIADRAGLNSSPLLSTDEPDMIHLDKVTVYMMERATLDRPAVLKNVSLDLPPRQHVLLVGANKPPSGKKTLALLLLRNEDCSSGTVSYGSRSVLDWGVKSWKRLASVISTDKDTFVFEENSLEENIRLWDSSISALHIRDAIKETGLSVSMDLSSLSIEDRQRIAVARVLARRPKIVVIEEQTSHSLNLINKQIKELKRTAVCVQMQHTLEGYAHADFILVMNNGELEWKGKPADIAGTNNEVVRRLMHKGRPMDKSMRNFDLKNGVIEKINYIRGCALFSWLDNLPSSDNDTLAELEELFQVATYQAGAEICRQKKRATVLCIVTSGRVSRVRMDELTTARQIVVLQPGDYFGEKYLAVQGGQWEDTYVAEEKTVVLSANASELNMRFGDKIRQQLRIIARGRATARWKKAAAVYFASTYGSKPNAFARLTTALKNAHASADHPDRLNFLTPSAAGATFSMAPASLSISTIPEELLKPSDRRSGEYRSGASDSHRSLDQDSRRSQEFRISENKSGGPPTLSGPGSLGSGYRSGDPPTPSSAVGPGLLGFNPSTPRASPTARLGGAIHDFLSRNLPKSSTSH